MSKLEEIVETNKDNREVAEFAGITLTLEQYDFLVQQAKQAKTYKSFYELAEAFLGEDDFYTIVEEWNEEE